MVNGGLRELITSSSRLGVWSGWREPQWLPRFPSPSALKATPISSSELRHQTNNIASFSAMSGIMVPQHVLNWLYSVLTSVCCELPV